MTECPGFHFPLSHGLPPDEGTWGGMAGNFSKQSISVKFGKAERRWESHYFLDIQGRERRGGVQNISRSPHGIDTPGGKDEGLKGVFRLKTAAMSR